MSIEKIDFSYVSQEKKKFTTHLNAVLQNLTDPAALGVWAYLSSLPEKWTVNKAHLRKHFNIGRDKMDRILSYLEKNNLLVTGQERLEDGRLGKGYIFIKCGYEFEEITYPQETPHTEKPYTVNPCHGKSAPINNINNINKTKRERERSALVVKDDEKPFLPDNKSLQLCTRLGLDIDEELNSFTHRHKGEKTQYEFERWMKSSKEYKDKKQTDNKTGNKQVTTEIKSCVKEYGPGHPTWELNRAWENKHGSTISGDNIGRRTVRKATAYLP